jgi:uncharacterized protein HemY
MEWFMSMDVLVVLLAVGSIVIGAVTNLFILSLLIWLIVRYLRNGRVVKKWSERLRQTRSKDRI